MKPARLNQSLAIVLAVLLAFIAAFFAAGLASNGVDFPLVLLTLLIAGAVIIWLISLSIPSGDYDPKLLYLWRVETTGDQVLIAAQNPASQQRAYYGSRIFLGFFILACAIAACFFWIAPFVENGFKPETLFFYLGFGFLLVLICANFAYNLWKTPFLALEYQFDVTARVLRVSGKNWRGQVQTQHIAFANIKLVYAVTGKGSTYIRHHMIRIDALEPHQYFVINTQMDDVEEARYYLEAIRTVLPDKIRDELGAGKLWIDP